MCVRMPSVISLSKLNGAMRGGTVITKFLIMLMKKNQLKIPTDMRGDEKKQKNKKKFNQIRVPYYG